MTTLFFADGAADRGAEARIEEAAQYEMQRDENARYLIVRRGRVRANGRSPMRIAWSGHGDIPEALEEAPVFLGSLADRPCFAIVSPEVPLTAAHRFGAAYGVNDDGFVGLYDAAMGMAPAEARLAARAVHFANWINRTRYCGACGTPTRAGAGGHKRTCSNARCGREEFPRTDPVVIALVTHGDRCLLGRQPKFPPGRYSAIAGFVEPGETLEDAVRREVDEEAGLRIGGVTYRGSQPWPFPTSLMVGFLAEASSDTIALNDGELEDARWFERSDVAAWAGAEPKAEPPIRLPPRGVMARALIEDWLFGGKSPRTGAGGRNARQC